MRVEGGGWHVVPELPARDNGEWRQWRRRNPRLTRPKPAVTGAIFWLLRHFNWRNSQKMALNRAKTIGKPTGNPARKRELHWHRHG
jgi:hypothetical protein